MRCALPILMLCALLPSGCSFLIASCGTNVYAANTKEQVHAKFGNPSASGVEDGKPFEEFCTRQKISEDNSAGTLLMAIGATYGTAELFYFPYELYLLGKRTLVGRRLRFTYDSDGNVKVVSLEADDPLLPRFVNHATGLQASGENDAK